MTDRFTRAAASGNAPIRALLDAVLDAIDLPHPATFGDAEKHDQTLAARASFAAVVARAALAGHPDDIPWNVDYLRARLAEHPVDYQPWAAPQPTGAQRDGGLA